MRLSHIFLVIGTASFALPSPPPNPPLRPSNPPAKALTLTQPLNTTRPQIDAWPTICYHDNTSPHIDHLSCAPLIAFFESRALFRTPQIWPTGPDQPQWALEGCRVRILSGKRDSVFSMQDVVAQMEGVLAVCQPPRYTGIGGSAPVNGVALFMYAAFHVQVTGVRP